MTSTEAINRIKNLLFSKQSFSLMKTKQGAEVSYDGELEVEKEIYIITPNGEIPVPDGRIEMEDGLEIEVEAGKITKMNYPKMEDEKMVSAELIDGTIVESDADILQVGDTLFVVTPEGRSAAPDGEHQTTDGKIVVVSDGVITDIKDAPVEKAVEEEMSSDTLADGTKIETDEEGEFKVGQQLYFITSEGEKVPALSGEHTTESGIVITTDSNGVITGVKYPDQEGEGSLSDFEMLMDLFTKGFEKLNSEIEEIKNNNKKLQADFSKFSAEPAGERLYFQKDLINHIKSTQKDKLELLAQLKRQK